MLSKKAQYALKATGYLATKYGAGPVGISEISERKKIPLKFLENILLELRKAGVLESKKGKGGGYYLVPRPEDVSLARILRLVDGPISMIPCVSLNFYKQCDDCDEVDCKLNKVFSETRNATLAILENKTLRDL